MDAAKPTGVDAVLRVRALRAAEYRLPPEGEAVSLFGISGYLEIALNRAPAQDLLGIQINERIQVEFL